MKWMHLLMFNCRKATFLVSKQEEQKLSFGERMRLSIHLSMCKFCKEFEKQSSLIATKTTHLSSVSELTEEDISRFKRELKK